MSRIEITSDGSCHHRRKAGGWAAVIVCWPDDGKPYAIMLDDNARTNDSYFCEIVPIVDALKKIPDGVQASITIHSDHDGLVKLIENSYADKRREGHIRKKWFKDKGREGILMELRDELMRLDVRAQWMRGHSNNQLHNFVDMVAGQQSQRRIWE